MRCCASMMASAFITFVIEDSCGGSCAASLNTVALLAPGTEDEAIAQHCKEH